MLFRLWKWIQLWLPYGLILFMYRRNKALTANIRTREGNTFKAILIDENYGVLFSSDTYIRNRGLYLKEQKGRIDAAQQTIIDEINALPFEEREKLYGYLQEDN